MRQSNKHISEEQVVAEFAIRRAKITKLAVIVGILAGAAIIFLYMGIASNVIAAILFVAILIPAALVNVKLWRCPACNAHLGKLYLGLKGPKYCPACATKLRLD